MKFHPPLTISENIRRKFSIAGIGLGMIATGMIFSMLNLTLPTLSKELDASMLQLQWVMNVFGIFVCATLVLFGRLADIYGRKKICLLGLVFIVIAVSFDALSHSMSTIIAMQALTGMGNAIMLASTQAMMVHEFEREQRGRAIGLWASIIGISLAIGPLIAGLLIGMINWRAVFVFLAISALIAIGLIALCSRDSKNETEPPKLDLIGAMLLMVMIAALVIAIIQLHTWPLLWCLAFGAIAICAGVLLYYVESRVSMPIVKAELLKNRLFMLSSINSGLLVFAIWSLFFLLPFFLQIAAGYSTMAIGMIMLFVALPLIILSPIIGRYCRRSNAWIFICSGFLLLILSLLLQLCFGESPSLWLVIIAILSFGCGWSLVWGPVTTMAISTLPHEQTGIASGTYNTFQEIGGTLGAAISIVVARSSPHFIDGFDRAILLLLGLMVVGCVLGWIIKLLRI